MEFIEWQIRTIKKVTCWKYGVCFDFCPRIARRCCIENELRACKAIIRPVNCISKFIGRRYELMKDFVGDELLNENHNLFKLEIFGRYCVEIVL